MLVQQSEVSPDAGFLRLPQVLRLFPVSRSSWWSGVKSGKYPRAYKIGLHTTAWRVCDIRALLDKVANQAAAASKSGEQK